jgi:hypothetical protein
MDSLFEQPLHHMWKVAYPTQEDFDREAEIERLDVFDGDKGFVNEQEISGSKH